MRTRLQDRRAYNLIHVLRGYRKFLPHPSCIYFKGCLLGDVHALDEADRLSDNFPNLGSRYLNRTNGRYPENIFEQIDNFCCRLPIQHHIDPTVFLLDLGCRISPKQVLYMRQSRFLKAAAISPFHGNFAEAQQEHIILQHINCFHLSLFAGVP
ncbi:hypothetical protein D3C77_343600 [compost metagenome]